MLLYVVLVCTTAVETHEYLQSPAKVISVQDVLTVACPCGGEWGGGSFYTTRETLVRWVEVHRSTSLSPLSPQMADTIDINFQSDLMAIFEENLF